MSFAQEVKDFSAGFDTGVKYWNDRSTRKYRDSVTDLNKRKLEQSRIPTEDDYGAIPNPFGGGGKRTATDASGGGKYFDASEPGTPQIGAARRAISDNESGSNYNALGIVIPKTGDRAYGKYQIMGNNIPSWTKQYLGQEMTPQEFLKSPEAQDKVFDGEFGRLADKYGWGGAAQAWLGGEGSVGKTDRADPLGTSIGSYSSAFLKKFNQYGGGGQQETQVAAKTPQGATDAGASPQADKLPKAGGTQAQPAGKAARATASPTAAALTDPTTTGSNAPVPWANSGIPDPNKYPVIPSPPALGDELDLEDAADDSVVDDDDNGDDENDDGFNFARGGRVPQKTPRQRQLESQSRGERGQEILHYARGGLMQDAAIPKSGRTLVDSGRFGPDEPEQYDPGTRFGAVQLDLPEEDPAVAGPVPTSRPASRAPVENAPAPQSHRAPQTLAHSSPAARGAGAIPMPGDPDPASRSSTPEWGQRSTPSTSSKKAGGVRNPPPGEFVSRALDGGIRFLQDTFGLHPEGAIATPNDGVRAQAGTQRFVNGEGAMTPEEINQIDDKIDPDRELTEGDRHANRLAKMTSWYLEHGRSKDAAGSAAGLLQYGAQRFGQLGNFAGAALKQFQEDGDPKHLTAATRYIDAAYDMIPDGGAFDINIHPKTGLITAKHTDGDGKSQTYSLTPQELPSLIRSMQDRSLYWNNIYSLADPQGARAKQKAGFDAQKTEDKRTQTLADEERKHGIKTQDELDKEERKKKADIEKRDELRAYNEAHPKSGGGAATIDEGAYRSTLADASDARKAYKDAKKNSTDGDKDPAVQALREKYDSAASRFADSLPFKSRSLELQRLGMNDFNYVEPPAANAITSRLTQPESMGGPGGFSPTGQTPPAASRPPADESPGAAMGRLFRPPQGGGQSPAAPQSQPVQPGTSAPAAASAAPRGPRPAGLPPGARFDKRSGLYAVQGSDGKWHPLTPK